MLPLGTGQAIRAAVPVWLSSMRYCELAATLTLWSAAALPPGGLARRGGWLPGLRYGKSPRRLTRARGIDHLTSKVIEADGAPIGRHRQSGRPPLLAACQPAVGGVANRSRIENRRRLSTLLPAST